MFEGLCCEASDCTKELWFPACTGLPHRFSPSRIKTFPVAPGFSMWARGWTEQKCCNQRRRSSRPHLGLRLHSKVKQWLTVFINDRHSTLLPPIWKPTAWFKCNHGILKMSLQCVDLLESNPHFSRLFADPVGSHVSAQCNSAIYWQVLPCLSVYPSPVRVQTQTRLSFGGKLLPADSASCRLLQRNGLLDHL